MPDQTAPEPTMEEILASIRRIISEDDAPEGQGVSNEAAAVDEDEPDYAVEADEPVAGGDVPYHAEPDEPEPEAEFAPPAPTPVAAAPSPARDDTLLSPRAASAAASAFSELSAAASQPREGRTLEDIAKELMAPVLRQWLDDNLPRIVQAAVRDEVERISRGRVG